jgi:hypothetical protein
MRLIQIFLPVYDNDGRRFPPSSYAQVRRELVERFGGLTAYNRAPAEGLWQDDGGPTTRDEIVVYEVMTERLDREWWAQFRAALAQRLDQEDLVVRALVIDRL